MTVSVMYCLQCFDAVGWAAGRASGMSGGVLESMEWLSVRGNVQFCIWPSWCHCHTVSCSGKMQIHLPFLYWITRVVMNKWPLNRCCFIVCFTHVYIWWNIKDILLNIHSMQFAPRFHQNHTTTFEQLMWCAVYHVVSVLLLISWACTVCILFFWMYTVMGTNNHRIKLRLDLNRDLLAFRPCCIMFISWRGWTSPRTTCYTLLE